MFATVAASALCWSSTVVLSFSPVPYFCSWSMYSPPSHACSSFSIECSGTLLSSPRITSRDSSASRSTTRTPIFSSSTRTCPNSLKRTYPPQERSLFAFVCGLALWTFWAKYPLRASATSFPFSGFSLYPLTHSPSSSLSCQPCSPLHWAASSFFPGTLVFWIANAIGFCWLSRVFPSSH